MTKAFRIAIIGATGAVGEEMLKVLEERNFPVGELLCFSSPRSKDKVLKFRDQKCVCRVAEKGCFRGIDLAFFDASDEISKNWTEEAAASGAWVIDNSSVYRLNKDVPLIVPEVNGETLTRFLKEKKGKIIAGPNCSTVQLVIALKPFQDRWGLKRVVVSSYQSVSGVGRAAMSELAFQSDQFLKGANTRPEIFPHPIAFNCIPQIGTFKEDLYTSEEHKIMDEAKKLLEMPGLRITATAIRVPTFRSHAESVNVECERPFTLEEAREALHKQPGIELVDQPQDAKYPLGLHAAGKNPVYVGRVRMDDSAPNALNFWIVADNLRKGAALNAVQIGERVLEIL